MYIFTINIEICILTLKIKIMKKNYFLIIAMLVTTLSFGQFTINEIYYSDSNDFVELKGPAGADFSGWTISYYKHNGQLINTIDLSSAFDPSTMPVAPAYNGQTMLDVYGDVNSPGGYVILKDDSAQIIDFFAYGNGTSERTIGVETSVYTGDATAGNSIQLTDAGWVSGLPTPGDINTGQTLSVAKNQIAGFAMYPNPVSNGEFMVSSSNGADKHVEIYSMIGKLVYSKNVKSRETIQVSNLNTGVYVIKVEEEGKLATHKLIIK